MIKSILVARDITKRKNSEIILQESEAKHRFLIETSQEMICLHDNTGHFKFVSPSMTKMAGYTPEELIGKDPYSFLHPDDINLVLEKNHKPSLAGTKSPSFQFRLRKKDETYIWLDSYIEPITDEKGKVISLLTGSRDISELKNIEIALEERNSFIENITNNLPGVVLQYRQHKDGRDEFSYFNKEAEHLWEIAPEVIKNDIGKVWEQVHKDDVEALRESFEHSKTELSIWENEHRFVMPDGRVKWLSCVGVPHRDSAGTTTWDNLLFDVTEKKKTQIELARSQEMVSNIANSIPGVVWIYIRQLNGVDTVDYISEGALRIFEISKEEILDDITSLWKMIHSDDLFEFVKSVDQSAKNLMPWKYDYRIVMPDGRVKWLSGGGNPRVLENGSIMWHSIALDVTDKKNIELDLKKTLKQLKLSIATGKMGIWELNLENGYLDWNDQMFNIFGVDKLSFDHKVETFNKCVHPEDLDFITNVISKFPENDKLADVQFRIIKPDGKIRHILVSGNPSTFNENGEFEKYIGVNIDVTHIAEYQEQLKASVEEKDALFKELHHRIKNNLQMVASLLYIKSTMTEETALKRFIDETSAKIHSISSIHEQLLQMKGIDKLDVKQYLDSLCRNLIQTYSYGYTKFDLTIDLDSAHMDIDKVLNLGLIVNEILSNAIKYAYPSGTNGKINVYLKHNNGQSILTVSDEGVGIPKEKLAGMNNSYGMQLITLFTKQIGGTLDIESENGAKFIIIFPTNG
jgi:PAS domain S-box-containing protein